MLIYEEYLPEVKSIEHFEAYLAFIEEHRETERVEGEYYEVHHVVPQCYLPENYMKTDKQNLVCLRGKNHFFAHKLLFFALQDSKMAYALWGMSHMRDEQGSLIELTEDEYEKVREAHAENVSKFMKEFMKGRPGTNLGKHFSEIHKERISQSQLGRKFTDEHKKNLSDAHKGYIMPETQKLKISDSLTGIEKDDEWRHNLSISNKGKPHGVRGGKHVYREDKQGNIVERTVVAAHELDNFLSDGWKQGRPGLVFKEDKITIEGRIKINNGQISKYIYKEELTSYEKQGWVKGGLSKKNDR